MPSSIISRTSNLPRRAPSSLNARYPQLSTASNADFPQSGYPATEKPPCKLIYLHGYCSYGKSCRFAHPPGYEGGVPENALIPVASYAPQPSVFFPIPGPNPTFKNSGATLAAGCYDSSLVSLPAEPAKAPTKATHLAHKTAPCRHYARNGGWCPVGDECNFVHDFAFPPRENASVRSKVGSPQRKKSRHCWAFVQGRCRDSRDECEYFHPEASQVTSYEKYTPCPVGKTCPNRNDCGFKHMSPGSTQPVYVPNNGAPYLPTHIRGLAPLEEEPSSVEGSTYYPTADAGFQFPNTVNNSKNDITNNRNGIKRRGQHRRTITLDERKISCASLAPGEVRGHARRRSIVCNTGEVWVHNPPASQLQQRNSFDVNMFSGPLMGGRRNREVI